MSMRSALAGAATTAVLVAALGNPGVVDAARDADDQALGVTVTGFPNWDTADLPGDVVGGIVLRLGLAVALAAALCALAGQSHSRGAAFVGGWGALVVAAGAASVVAYVYQVAVVLDGNTLSSTYLDGLVLAANAGAAFGLWTGWLVGVPVALVTRPALTPRQVDTRSATPWPTPASERRPAEARITEPPPPWWAPTQGGGDTDALVRPGPTAFPPGGIPSGPSTHELATASGDPHPSDPGATPSVGMPRPDERADHDMTTPMPEQGSDRTTPMRRKPD